MKISSICSTAETTIPINGWTVPTFWTKICDGKGTAYYIAFRNADDFHGEIIDRILKEKGITSDFDGVLHTGVTAHSRTDGETLFVFLENFSTATAKTSTSFEWRTVDTGETIKGAITLAPYETVILKRKL